MKKRVLKSVLLCLCIALALLPVILVQAENDSGSEPVEQFGTKEEVFDALGLPVDDASLQGELNSAPSPYGDGIVVTNTVSELYGTEYQTSEPIEDGSSGRCFTSEDPDFADNEKSNILGRTKTDSFGLGYERLYAVSEELSLLQDGKVNFVAELMLSKFDTDNDDTANGNRDAALGINLYYLDASGVRSTLTCTDAAPVIMTLSLKDENKVSDGDSSDGWENNGWEYDAIMEMVAGDFDGDSMDELAVYDPAAGVVRIYEITLGQLDENGKPGSFSLTEMSEAAINVPQQSYVSRYTVDGDGHYTDTQKIGYQLMHPVVSLEAVDFARDFKDELAMAVSPNFYRSLVGYGYGSALFVYNMNGDLNSAPTMAYEQKLEWSDEDGYNLSAGETQSMRYVGVAAGDIDGDSGIELIAAGYHTKTGWNDNYGTDGNILYTILGYDGTNDVIVNEMQGAAGVVKPGAQIGYLADGHNEECGDYKEHSYVPPVKVATAKTEGPNQAARVLMGDCLYQWLPEEQYDGYGVTGMGLSGSTSMIGKMEELTYMHLDSSGWWCCYITDVAVGNFDGNIMGYEQLVASVIHKDGRGVGASAEFWYHSLSYNGSYSPHQFKMADSTSKLHSSSLLSVNYDNEDSTYLKPVGRELRYSSAAVLAVLQAAPYFEDLTVLDGDYGSGGTSFGASAGIGGSMTWGAEVTSSIGVEFEQGIDVFGINLFQAGAEGGFEHSISTEFSVGFETTTGISYETGSEDSVVVFTVPQFVYHYEMWVPEMKVPSNTSDYNTWIAQRVDLAIYNNYDTDRTDGDGLSEDEIAVIREEITNSVKREFNRGDTVVAHWEPFSVVVPLEMVNTVIPVDAYDEVAERCGLQPVRGTVLNSTVGDPSSYTYRPFFFQPVYSGVGIGDSSITKDFSTGASSEFSLGISDTVSGQGKVGLVGFNLIIGASASASLSAGVSVSTGLGYSGTVNNLPEGADDYGFNWTFGYDMQTVNAIPVPVLQYHATNVQEPPSLPVNLQVDSSTDSSITLSWERGRKIARSYEIYLYDAVYDRNYLIATVDGTKISFTHTDLLPNTSYSYRLAAVNDATSSSILSQIVIGRTTPLGADAPRFITHPKSISAYPGMMVRFESEATSQATGTMFYQWQRRIGGAWKDISGARSRSYTVSATTENDGASYRCRAYQIISGGVAEAFSDVAVLNTAKLTPIMDIVALDNSLENTPLTLRAMLASNATHPEVIPTGTVSYEVLCLAGGGANVTLDATYSETENAYVAGWTPTMPGFYRVISIYSGDTRYLSASDSFEFYVTEPGKPLLTVTADLMTYGESQTFEALLDGESVTGVTYSVNGVALTNREFTPAAAGNYVVTASYIDDDNKEYTANASFTVHPAILTVTATDSTTEFGTKKDVTFVPDGLHGEDSIPLGAFTVTAVESYQHNGTPNEVSDSTPVGAYPVVIDSDATVMELLADRYTVVLQNGTYTVVPITYNGTLRYDKIGDGTVAATADSGDVISSTTPVIFTAAPAFGNRVAGWSVQVGNQAPVVTEGDIRTFTYTLTESQDVTVTVTFIPDRYEVTFSAEKADQGTVSAEIDGTKLYPGGDVPVGQQVTFAATAAEGFELKGWKLNGSEKYYSTQEACSLAIMKDSHMQAVFQEKNVATYNVTVSSLGNGNVTPTGIQTVGAGGSLSVTATPANSYYVFGGWTITGLEGAQYTVTDNPISLTDITADGGVTANFLAKTTYPVWYDTETVSGATADGIAFRSGERIDAGALLVFTAKVPAEMYVKIWSVDNEEQPEQIFNTFSLIHAQTVNNVSVSFTDVEPVVTVTFDGNGGTWTAAGQAAFPDGTKTDLPKTALSAPTEADITKVGHTLTGWMPAVPGTIPFTPATYTAQWMLNRYTLAFDVNTANGGKGSAPASVIQDYNTTYVLTETATPAVDTYAFVGWYTAAIGGTKVSSYNFPEDTTVYAHYLPTYRVIFDEGAYGKFTNAADARISQTRIVSGTTVNGVPAIAERSDATFIGWRILGDSTLYSYEEVAAMPITSSVTFIAAYQSNAAPSGLIAVRKDAIYSVTLSLIDADIVTVKLSGATFALYQSDGTLVATESIGADGTLTVPNLANGSYYFIETVAPTGYQLDSSKHTFTIDGSDVAFSVTNERDSIAPVGGNVPDGLNCSDHIPYVMGYSDGTVRPNNNITRAEVATMFYRLLTEIRRDAIFTNNNSFSDVSKDLWFNKAVSSMAVGGYIQGYPDGTFGGSRSITRAEFIAIAVRFTVAQSNTVSFTDVPASYWAYPHIATAVHYGWTNGYTDGSFRPNQPITRAEAMTIINRMLGRGVGPESKLLNFKNWQDNQVGAWYYYDVLEATTAHTYEGSRPFENWTSLSTNYYYDIAKYEQP